MTSYLVMGRDGIYAGPYTEQDEALAERESLIAQGDECWLQPVLTDCDPGDETEDSC